MARLGTLLSVTALASSFAVAASAQGFENLQLRQGSGGAFAMTGGMVDLLANEYVWDGDTRLSQLVWRSQAFVIRLDLAQRRNRMTFAGGLSVGFGGNGSMVDQDWIPPYATGTGWDDWSHQSNHDDTTLDRYIDAFGAVGLNVIQRQRVTANVRGGFRYTDVRWSARGGSYIYSDTGFRDTQGTIPAGTEVIDYRQQIPSAFAGLAVGVQLGRLTLGAEVEAGLTVLARAVDDHWLRDLNFVDHLESTPTLHVGFSGAYAFPAGFSLVVKASYDRVYTTGGDTVVTDTTTDVQTTEPGAAGADLRAISATMGLRLVY